MNVSQFKPQRINNPNSYKVGWAFYHWYRNKVLHSRFFADKQYGGSRKAKAACEKHIKEYKETMPQKLVDLYNRVETHGMAYKNKGVWLETRERNGIEYENWATSYRQDGESKRKSFAVNKYGYREAKKLAQRFRDTGIIEKVKR